MHTNKNILLIDNTSNTINKLEELLMTYGKVTKVEYNNIPENINQYNLIVLSGSHNIYLDNPKLTKEIELIKNSNIPIIGICFGFELICKTFGSEISQLNELTDDFRFVNIDREYFKNFPEHIGVKEYHEFCVKKVEAPLHALGTSDTGVEIVKHFSKSVVGFQFHPELYITELQGDDLLTYVIKKLPF